MQSLESLPAAALAAAIRDVIRLHPQTEGTLAHSLGLNLAEFSDCCTDTRIHGGEDCLIKGAICSGKRPYIEPSDSSCTTGIVTDTGQEEVPRKVKGKDDNISDPAIIKVVEREQIKASHSSESGKSSKPFDMSRYHQRHVALQLQYDGRPYYGFASQIGECDDTVEKHLFDALCKTRLVTDRSESSYTRCGRTDKGVSALGQVVAFRLRSSMPKGIDGALVPKHPCDPLVAMQGDVSFSTSSANPSAVVSKQSKEVLELDYCELLNKNLPAEIRVLGWNEVTPEFNARFSASGRKYRYFFVRKNLDITAMQTAASFLLGEHDFRNFCKMNIGEVSNFRREIFKADVLLFEENTAEPERSVYMLEIEGIAFLWHMVRCCMAILLLVGEKKETPDIVLKLLDIETVPAKPNYHMATEEPLVLHSCGFDNLTMKWTPKTLWSLTEHYEKTYEKHAIAAAQALNALRFLKTCEVRVSDLEAFAKPAICSSSVVAAHADVDMDPGTHAHAQLGKEEPPKKRSRSLQSISASSSPAGSSPDSPGTTLPASLTWGRSLEILKESYDIDYPYERFGMPGNAGKSSSSKHGSAKPVAGSKGRYITLLQRPFCEDYDTRVAQVGGARKSRLERHMTMKDKNKLDGKQFFDHLRKQGNVDGP
jgi:tRNA pseudouridine38/39 synthase